VPFIRAGGFGVGDLLVFEVLDEILMNPNMRSISSL